MHTGPHAAEAQPEANRPKGTFSTASARTTPIEYTRAERFWFCLERRIRLPRLPRPSIRSLLSSIAQLIPARLKASPCGRLAKNHSALAAWAGMFAAAALVIAGQQFIEPHYKWEPERYQKWLAHRGARAVKVSLAEIGPAVTIPAVNAEPAGKLIAGYYALGSGEITFNSSVEHISFFLLETAAHECVHGLFVQNNLSPARFIDDDYLHLVNEVAAYVLGAHIVGAVMSQDGHDGSIITEALFQCAYPRSSTTGRRFLGGIQHALFHVQGALRGPRASCRRGA